MASTKLKCGGCGRWFASSRVDQHLSSAGHKAGNAKTLQRLDKASKRGPGAYSRELSRAEQVRKSRWSKTR